MTAVTPFFHWLFSPAVFGKGCELTWLLRKAGSTEIAEICRKGIKVYNLVAFARNTKKSYSSGQKVKAGLRDVFVARKPLAIPEYK